MENTAEAARVRAEKEARREVLPGVVVISRNEAAKWTREEAWEVYWEKVQYAAE